MAEGAVCPATPKGCSKCTSVRPDWVSVRCRAPQPTGCETSPDRVGSNTQTQTNLCQTQKPSKRSCVRLHVAFKACGKTWDLRTKQSSARAVVLPILAPFWFLGPMCVTGTTGDEWKTIVNKVCGVSNTDLFFGIWWDKRSSECGLKGSQTDENQTASH